MKYVYKCKYILGTYKLLTTEQFGGQIHISALEFGMSCPKAHIICNGQVSTYLYSHIMQFAVCECFAFLTAFHTESWFFFRICLKLSDIIEAVKVSKTCNNAC